MDSIPFDNIIFLLQRSIVPRKHDHMSPVEYAYESGMYMGCPGKELYFSLPSFSVEQIEKLIPIVCMSFPKLPPGRSVHFSVFWRYFYGVFDKRGVFNSKHNLNNITSNWPIYFSFVDSVIEHYKSMSCIHFGQIIATEMLAHRFGDKFVLSADVGEKIKHKKQMIECYENTYKLAIQIKAKKNAFSSLYWCSSYLFGNDNALYKTYAIRFLQAANQFATSVTTKGKVVSTLNRLNTILSRKEMKSVCKMYKNFDNKIMKSFGFRKLNFDKSTLGIGE